MDRVAGTALDRTPSAGTPTRSARGAAGKPRDDGPGFAYGRTGPSYGTWDVQTIADVLVGRVQLGQRAAVLQALHHARGLRRRESWRVTAAYGTGAEFVPVPVDLGQALAFPGIYLEPPAGLPRLPRAGCGGPGASSGKWPRSPLWRSQRRSRPSGAPQVPTRPSGPCGTA